MIIPIKYTRAGEKMFGMFSTSADAVVAYEMTEADLIAQAGELARIDAEEAMRRKLCRGVESMRSAEVTRSVKKAVARGDVVLRFR